MKLITMNFNKKNTKGCVKSKMVNDKFLKGKFISFLFKKCKYCGCSLNLGSKFSGAVYNFARPITDIPYPIFIEWYDKDSVIGKTSINNKFNKAQPFISQYTEWNIGEKQRCRFRVGSLIMSSDFILFIQCKCGERLVKPVRITLPRYGNYS
jgi:hypothetical protein